MSYAPACFGIQPRGAIEMMLLRCHASVCNNGRYSNSATRDCLVTCGGEESPYVSCETRANQQADPSKSDLVQGVIMGLQQDMKPS